MGIPTVESLRTHLQWAMGVELALIPPYLYAMYSIRDTSSEAYRLIRSVVAEEMLHAALDANMLVAIGGDPGFYVEQHCPSYPMPMPHHKPPLILDLAPLNKDVLDLFMLIEQPKETDTVSDTDEYETQGEFYVAIEQAFERLNETEDLFAANLPERQMGDPAYYAPVEFDAADSGGLIHILGIDDAREAIEIVIHQGEGLHEEHWADPDELELTHYFKYKELAEGDVELGEIWPMATNPKTADFDPALQRASNVFNAAYSYLLVTLDEIYEPLSAADRAELVQRLYSLMVQVMSPVGKYLAGQPHAPGSAVHAGPTFEFYEFESVATAGEELAALVDGLAEPIPGLDVTSV